MLQQYKILTVTHRHTNLKEIGQYSIAADNQSVLYKKLSELKEFQQLDELFYTATCNRVLFVFTTAEELSSDFVQRFFQQVNPQLTAADLQQNVRTYTGEDAINHLFLVSSSIDSLVIGERQILKQIREAVDKCQKWNFLGDDLRLLFQRMVLAAKDVYSNTKIGEKPVSVVSLAVQKLMQSGLPKDARILLIGAGQTNNLVAKFLVKYGYEKVTVFNRSEERAQMLAQKFNNAAYHALDVLNDFSGGFDCAVVCTGANEPILTLDVVNHLLEGESAEDKVIVDLAIPHNTAPEVADSLPLEYIEIEGLRHLAQENMSFRKREIDVAKALLHTHLEEFPILYKQRQLERALHQVPKEIRAIRQRAMNEVFRKEVDQLDDTARALVEEMMAYMEKKCIGIPMKAAREALI